MRRKSTRNTTKASPEKAAETSTSTRRSRRHSKRRKRSSSRSSSEGSDDVSLKTVAQQMAEVPAEDVPNISLPGEEDAESIWKVKPSAAPRGEIQKLKICLTRPPASPEKVEPPPTGRRRRNKSSGSQFEDDIVSPDEKTSRKAKHRSSSGVSVDELEEQNEETEDKKGKGKSKTKNKSKSEKTPKIQDIEDQTESEISENVQVTPQSPQAAIDIRVDNENVSTIERETVDSDKTETNPILHNANTSESCDVTSGTNENVAEETTDDAIDVQPQPSSDSAKPQSDGSNSQPEVDFKGFHVSTQEISTQQEQTETVIEAEKEIQAEPTEEQVVEFPEQEIIVDQNVEEIVVQCEDDYNQIEESTSPATSEVVVVQSKDNINEMQEVRQKPTSSAKSGNLEKMDVESGAQSGTEEMQISEEREEESIVGDIPETDSRQSEEEHTIEVISESTQIKKVHQTPLRRESKTESSSSEEPDVAEQKEEPDEQVEYQRSPIHNKDESSTMEESQRLDDDSRSADVIFIDSSSTPNKEESSFNLTQSFSPDVREIVEANKELQGLKDEIRELFPTPPSVRRRHKWGTSLVGLELLTPTLKIIDINSIKQLCPNLQILEENELRMEVREVRDRRRSLSEQKEKKSDRKVSIEHQSSDADHKRLETQDSVNSSEMEEVNEPEVDNSNIIAMNRKISIVDDTASKLKPPPSPAKNPVSEVLYITNLVRPFTLKQLKELLERTGKIKENGFWTDRIKSKCYVYYETIEEAEATRNALHGVHWPIGNGKKLIIDYATLEDLEKARNPAPPVAPPEEKVPEKENQVIPKKHKLEEPEKVVKERERHRSETHVREWDIGKEDLHRVKSRSRERESRNERNDRRKHRRTPSPVEDFISRKQRKKEEDIPQKLMDDLFRKTKITPSIYWLPLTPEEIATKQQQRLLRMAEHKRRMEESSRTRGGDYGRGAPYRRRYD